MKSPRYLIVVFLLCFANSAAAQQTGTETPKSKLVTVADLQKLRWIEGSWRGTGVNQTPFFERYRFENPTTLAVDGLEGDKVTDTTRFELKDGEFGGGNEGSRWVATAIDENSITFAPVAKARNWFRWERVNANSWKAVLNWPAVADKPARERVYNMERWPQPGNSPGSSESSRLIIRRVGESRFTQTAGFARQPIEFFDNKNIADSKQSNP